MATKVSARRSKAIATAQSGWHRLKTLAWAILIQMSLKRLALGQCPDRMDEMAPRESNSARDLAWQDHLVGHNA